MDEIFKEALRRCDLPGLIAAMWPESGAQAGRPGTIKALWRGEKKPSCSLWLNREGIWLYKDHATGESGNAYGWLIRMGYAKKEAVRMIMGEPGAASPTAQPGCNKEPPSTVSKAQLTKALSEAQARLRKMGGHPQLRRRGIGLREALAQGLGAWHNGLLIGIHDYHGQLVNLKVRRTVPYRGLRYYQPFAGLAQAAWHSSNCQDSPRILVVEGELNALVFHITTGLATIGVPGAESSPDWSVLQGKTLYLVADDDEAGRRALTRWAQEAERWSITAHALAPMAQDACELHAQGRVQELRRYAQQAAG